MSRVVIVGAGPGGLASAMLLARAGVDVTILERQPHVGGRTSSHGSGGYTFDLGPTFFLYPRVIEEIFRACGHELRDEVDMVRLDPQYHLVFGGGGSMRATPDIARMEREIASISPADAPMFRRFMEENRVKMERFRPVLEKPFHGLGDVLTWPMMRLLPLLRPWLSLDQELGRFFSDPRVKLAFSFQSKYLGMSPFNCPSLFSILSFLEYENGVFHPMGGCGAVSQAMARLAIDAGVKIRLGEAVESLEFDGRKIVAANTAQGRYACDRMVVNADFAHAMTSLVPDNIRSNWNNKKIESRRYSCSTFMLYLGVEGSFPDVEHHTIYMSRDYESNLSDIESRHRLSEDPSFYVHNPSRIDPSLAPRGHSSLYILVPVSHQHANIDWKTEAPRFREKVLDHVRRIGLPDLRPLIRHERMITPADWENGHAIYRGATFNLAHNLGQMLHLRPGNRFADLEGVYLTGGGTHPGSGLPVIYESARISSRLLLQDIGLPYDHCMAEETGARPSNLLGRLFAARESRGEKHQMTA
jgi:phytoene desaturase